MVWRNLLTCHHRWMMRYLRKRGWVVFYLEPIHRTRCKDPWCWFNLYLDGEKHGSDR
jgi:hypothetical protein